MKDLSNTPKTSSMIGKQLKRRFVQTKIEKKKQINERTDTDIAII